ncbi:MAG TPA: hypothetical protein VHO50_11185 [Bacteroidales bacterium]|nr:hypothetical protein [Bacteroidales bacterium]
MKRCILFLTILAFVNDINAQSLKESLGGISTSYRIYSDSVDLKATDQIIIQRAEKNFGTDTGGAGWGYAYQSFHLEFMTYRTIKTETFKYNRNQDNESKLELRFFNWKGNLLATKSIPYYSVDIVKNESLAGSPSFISIDLINIPIVLLDEATKIDMILKMRE